MSENPSFFARLKQRKLVQWTLAYGAAAFALLQGIDIVAQRFAWPEQTMRFVIIALSIGFFVTLILAWYHGERGAQRMTGTELLILSLLFAVGGGFLWHFASGAREQAVKVARGENIDSTVVSAPAKSSAVLPFDNLSRDPDNAYFSEGIQDEILTRLAKIAELKVISRTSTQRFKSSPTDLRQIAQQLGVANILEGSVQKAGDQVRVNVQLIEAATDAHLWAESYDRKLTDIFAVESEIARTVAETLQAKLTGSAAHVLAARPTENPEAHQLYLKGRYFWNRRAEESMKEAINYFQQAIALDPSYALAYAGLADGYALMPVYGRNPPKEDIHRSLAAARHAVELDDTLAEAHTSLANALVDDLQFAPADREFARAIALNPSYATAHQWFGESLQTQGRFQESFAEIKKAHDLDPLSLIINCVLGSSLSLVGHHDEAVLQLHRTLEMDPNFSVAQFILGQVLEDEGKLQDAAVAYEKAKDALPSPMRLAMLACLDVRLKKTAEARAILADLTSRAQRGYVGSYSLALIEAALGDKEAALRLLEQACDERSIQLGGNTGSLKIDKRLDSLREDLRFQKLLARAMGQAQ
jgi:TolB-like protein/Tfp pilus assembly protein PilF